MPTPHEPWTWNAQAHPGVLAVLAEPANDLRWCTLLDKAPTDPVVGKVLCVCAAAAVAREVLSTGSALSLATASVLALLEEWIDSPTAERFDRMCGLIFPPEQSTLDGLVWGVLRTATSTAEGYGEAGWALESTCSAAVRAGFSPEDLRVIAEQAVWARAARSG